MYEYKEELGRKQEEDHAVTTKHSDQHRFYKMKKFEQTISRLSGQYKKLEKLLGQTKNEEVSRNQESLF